jgi:hypothetical protein
VELRIVRLLFWEEEGKEEVMLNDDCIFFL